jgi:hypothetical protein
MTRKALLARFPILIASTVILLLHGCASGPRFEGITAVPENKALLYIYREAQMLGAADSFEVFVNGKEIVRMTNGGYYVHTLEPGPVVISHRPGYSPVGLGVVPIAMMRAFEPEKKVLISFNAEPNGVYYVEWKVEVSGPKMETRDSEAAINSLKDCKLLEASAT